MEDGREETGRGKRPGKSFAARASQRETALAVEHERDDGQVQQQKKLDAARQTKKDPFMPECSVYLMSQQNYCVGEEQCFQHSRFHHLIRLWAASG